ncbi:Reactive Intermediate Deaminase [Vigna angularis]|uniref:Reactive Intermediate Deaminase n=1 Tax=Phaseolus angularis TaxID=3914 RepID=A0A8T0K440_PHAAN|nr:Reactive Intermediate Deaminase [Vigna angularis]
MASWCSVRSFQIPAMERGALRNSASLAAGVGCLSVAGTSFWRSSLSRNRSLPFTCLSISSDARVKESVQTDGAPAALGPYSQAIKADNLLFVSGVLGLVPEQIIDMRVFCSSIQTGKFVSDDVEEQTEQLLKNMGEILKAGGASYSSVVKTTIMLADLKDFKKVNEIYAKCEFCIVNFVDNVSLAVYILVEDFPSPFPARSTYQVAALPLDAKIEIECIATL